jgi:hypothetical protein
LGGGPKWSGVCQVLILGPADVPAKVAWRSDRDWNEEVYIAKADGTGGPVNVSGNGAFDGYPSLQGN